MWAFTYQSVDFGYASGPVNAGVARPSRIGFAQLNICMPKIELINIILGFPNLCIKVFGPRTGGCDDAAIKYLEAAGELTFQSNFLMIRYSLHMAKLFGCPNSTIHSPLEASILTIPL
jgi:hypothetical protein